MSVILVTPPSAPVLSLDEAREHLRVDAWGSPPSSPDDALIERMERAAVAEVDGWNGWLGRALVTQVWQLALDTFPTANGARIWLPLPPLQSVASVTYIDTTGQTQVLDPEAYRVVSDVEPGFVEPASGAWPATGIGRSAVRVRFTCGYGDDGGAVPELIRNYIAIRLGHFYDHREPFIAGAQISEVPHVRHSLENYRMRGALKGG